MLYLKHKEKYKITHIYIYELSSELYNHIVIWGKFLCNVHNA